ncbi:hypothetical protein Bbelb_177430 [Branchiostoma belcheri]|nr:hypothetical protein Bbelb_177430 [Branchiostoma belcheri]
MAVKLQIYYVKDRRPPRQLCAVEERGGFSQSSATTNNDGGDNAKTPTPPVLSLPGGNKRAGNPSRAAEFRDGEMPQGSLLVSGDFVSTCREQVGRTGNNNAQVYPPQGRVYRTSNYLSLALTIDRKCQLDSEAEGFSKHGYVSTPGGGTLNGPSLKLHGTDPGNTSRDMGVQNLAALRVRLPASARLVAVASRLYGGKLYGLMHAWRGHYFQGDLRWYRSRGKAGMRGGMLGEWVAAFMSLHLTLGRIPDTGKHRNGRQAKRTARHGVRGGKDLCKPSPNRAGTTSQVLPKDRLSHPDPQ